MTEPDVVQDSGPVDTGPWRIEPNRVSRFYAGGALLDRFRGVPEA